MIFLKNKKNFLSNIVNEKLKEARLARGYNTNELAKLFGVTRQAINKYEQGQMNPNPEIMKKYLDNLNFSMAYYVTPICQSTKNESAILFRSLATATESSRNMVAVRAEWIKRIIMFFEKYIDFPKTGFNRALHKEIYCDDDIEELAERLRMEWKIGFGPIDNISVLLQNHGAIIAKTNLYVEKSDACSKWVDKKPIIFLTSNKSAVHSRFDLAHELGHFILHNIDIKEYLDQKNIKLLDKEANRFAGAFLLPRSTFVKEIVSTSLDYFIELKKRWKVSIAAMIYRCKDLGILSESQTSYLWKQMVTRKIRIKEPLDDKIVFEEPTILKDAFELLIENNIMNPYEILSNCDNLPLEDFCSLVNISEEAFFVDQKNKKPILHLIK